MEISMDRAKELLENGVSEAQELIQDPSKVNDLLMQLEEKLADVPVAGTGLAQVPLMISMVKSYITREYSEVSPKVIASLVAAFLYMVKKKDLIPDNIPILGQLDDIAVVALALKLSEPELNAFKQWRDGDREEAAEACGCAEEATEEECGCEEEKPEEGCCAEETSGSSKILVAYFSASGVTADVASRMAQAVGAELYEIKPAVPYEQADLDWMDKESRSTLEMQDKNCRPVMADADAPVADADMVLIGFPVWWYREPSIIDTFLEAYDFTGKKVVPFCTSGGSSLGDTSARMAEIAGVPVLEGRRFAASASEEELREWVESL